MTLLLAIEAHEVKEGNGRLEGGLRDERDLLTRLKDSASIVRVKGKLGESLKTDERICIILIAKSCHKACFIWVTCVLTPHAFNIHCTHWTIKTKDSVDLDEV